MTENKTYRKKLTYAGGSLCVLSFIALILSLCAALIEPVGTMIYNSIFTRSIGYINASGISTYVYGYGVAVMTAAFSLAAFFTSARAKSKKKLDGAFAGTLITVSLVLTAMSAIMTFEALRTGTLSNAINYGYDNDIFIAAVSLAKDALPLISNFLLFIGGLVLASRLMGEDFAANIPYVKKSQSQYDPQAGAIPMPVQPAQPYIQPDLDQFRKPDNAEPVMAQVNNAADHDKTEAVPNQIQQPQPQQTPAEEKADVSDIADIESSTLTKCPNCGSELKEGAKFCSVCGNRL
ncbi:zinc ribbon domain-containing protein [Ruminococcus sp.]|uniref:zinc ribbon domain-containing protein n=1 Tax=Ruminococcus sp. TaxID=41978 RepID=UPI0025FA3462|nr:zinc ribbon domain-containing protein [Ruminococcus sp.]